MDVIIGTQESSPALDKTQSKHDILRSLKERINTFTHRPDIYQRKLPGQQDMPQNLGVTVADWTDLRRRKDLDLLQAYGTSHPAFIPAPGNTNVTRPDHSPYERLRPIAKAIKHSGRVKGNSGRVYTSKYRGVHQTFPTRRWEAQFRRNGKPTSLGCFDHEEEAAKAYDKMMLWCELHNAVGVKGGITNFEPAEYEQDIPWLQQVNQDELVQLLRSDGRRQAAARTARQRREGNGAHHQQQLLQQQQQQLQEQQQQQQQLEMLQNGFVQHTPAGTSALWQDAAN